MTLFRKENMFYSNFSTSKNNFSKHVWIRKSTRRECFSLYKLKLLDLDSSLSVHQIRIRRKYPEPTGFCSKTVSYKCSSLFCGTSLSYRWSTWFTQSTSCAWIKKFFFYVLTLVMMGGGLMCPPPKCFYFFTKNLSPWPNPNPPPVNS